MSGYYIEWRVTKLLEHPLPGIITRMKEAINLNTVGILGAALFCGGLAWKHFGNQAGKKEVKNNLLNKLVEEDEMNHELFDMRRLTNKKFIKIVRGFEHRYSNKVLVDTSFVENDKEEESIIENDEDGIRAEPDGASDSEEVKANKRDPMVSCSTFNSIVDDSMVDIVKTAKEARAMIRKLSFTPLQDGDGPVKFELGWDEESEDCVASFIRTNGADAWDRERETPVLSFKQSDCDFQYFDFDWDNSLGWVNDNMC